MHLQNFVMKWTLPQTITTFQNCFRGRILTGQYHLHLTLLPRPPDHYPQPHFSSLVGPTWLRCRRFLVHESKLVLTILPPSFNLFSSSLRVKSCLVPKPLLFFIFIFVFFLNCLRILSAILSLENI